MSRRPCSRVRCCPKDVDCCDEAIAVMCSAITDVIREQIVDPEWSPKQLEREQAEDPDI